jgi:hypothetical protein
MYRDTAIVERAMNGHTGNNWSHRIVTDGLMKNSGATSGKHSVDSVQKTAVLGTSHITRKYCSLKLEGWGSPLVQ